MPVKTISNLSLSILLRSKDFLAQVSPFDFRLKVPKIKPIFSVALSTLLILISSSLHANQSIYRDFDIQGVKMSSWSPLVWHDQLSEDQAKTLSLRTTEMYDFFSHFDRFQSEPYAVAVVDKNTLIPTNLSPYGLPRFQPSNDSFLLTIPIDNENIISKKIMATAAQESYIRVPLQSIGETVESASDKFLQMAVFHEMGHGISRGFGLNFEIKWFDELLANYFATLYLKKTDPDSLTLWTRILDSQANNYKKFTTLLQLQRESNTMELENYLWYLFRLQQLATNLEESYGDSLISIIQKMYDECKECRTDTSEISFYIKTKVPEIKYFINNMSQLKEPTPCSTVLDMVAEMY